MTLMHIVYSLSFPFSWEFIYTLRSLYVFLTSCPLSLGKQEGNYRMSVFEDVNTIYYQMVKPCTILYLPN
jgi:hypothetical protein